MKKLICMLLVLVLMMGAMVLPASAEEAVAAKGKIYELPGAYSGPIKVQDGLIICSKYFPIESDDFSGEYRYGIIDKTGKVIVPFEYSYLTFPDENGDIVGYRKDFSNLDAGITCDPYLIRSNGDVIDLRKYFGLTEDYLTAERIVNGAVLMGTNYGNSNGFYTKYRLIDIKTKKEVCPSFSAYQGPENVLCDGNVLIYDYNGTVYVMENGKSRKLIDLSKEPYIILQFIDGDWVYIEKVNGEYNFTVSIRVNMKTGAVENIWQEKGVEALIAQTQASTDLVRDSGKFLYFSIGYGYIDLVNDVQIGAGFEQADPIFTDGYFAVKQEGNPLWTYYSVDGKPTGQYYKDAGNFSNGVAFVTDEDGNTYVIDKNFNHVSENSVRLTDRARIDYFLDGVMAPNIDNRIFIYSDDPNYTFCGDVTGDGKVDVADIMKVKNCVMAEEKLPAADLNSDSKVDVEDIITLKALIMSI